MPLLSLGATRHSSTFTGSETAANLNSANAKTVTVKAKWKSNEPTIPTGACSGSYGRQVSVNLAVNGTQDFDYRGSVDCAYLQKAGYYKLEVWGAQGGSGKMPNDFGDYPYGGYSFGKIYSEGNSSLYISVGGKGTSGTNPSGGFNGGASATCSVGNGDCSSGGGATHIATVTGVLSSLSSSTNQAKVLIVAGGGGGSGGGDSKYLSGGSGGGIRGSRGWQDKNGSNGTANNGTCSTTWQGNTCVQSGGTQTSGGTAYVWSGYGTASNGSFGSGGRDDGTGNGAGGGGGWYGGGGAVWGGAGGGSGYIGNTLLLQDKGMYQRAWYSECQSSTTANTKTTCTTSTGAHVANTANTGNGYARITYLGT